MRRKTNVWIYFRNCYHSFLYVGVGMNAEIVLSKRISNLIPLSKNQVVEKLCIKLIEIRTNYFNLKLGEKK